MAKRQAHNFLTIRIQERASSSIGRANDSSAWCVQKETFEMNGMNLGKPQHVMMVAILSQACGTPQEGAETSGEVQSS